MTYEDMKNALALTDNPVEKLEMVMDFGAHMPSVPDLAQCHEITGCASRAEICIDGNHFYGRADSALVRGIVALVTARVDGMTADEIRNIDLRADFADLHLNLGAGRVNGLESMIRFLQNL